MNDQPVATEARLLKLVRRLNDKTRAGELQWERTTIPETFQSAFPNYVVRVSQRWPEDPEQESPDFYIAIKDQTGALIEQASDVEIARALPNSQAFSIMKELYTTARRQALAVDKALDALLDELQ